ncbi:DNA polymerase iota [Sitophilus oryzae]|uniref:DNA polymerase iota n=1 Tax=Sitophilus oryzae TaxID=7048 RepID=A0A6J2XZ81_SITOR|nr:DNA polymerase iota [Sitophilus oryzae]
MDDHSKTIIHIDVDCFYAQVEMNKNPELKTKPLGIQQKNIVVTSNYVAREYGITKCMLIPEAKKKCPHLELVNGEDLHDYRETSYNITSILQKYSNLVERLGLDENFVDVSRLVDEKIKLSNNITPVGHVFGNTEVLCDCGCTERLMVGSKIAQDIRDQIYKDLNLTTCAGIAHNKILAKIVCSKNKPNNQTTVFPNSASELMLSLSLVKNIPSIGQVTADQLSRLNINTVKELQEASVNDLEKMFGYEKSKNMIEISYGRDVSAVKKSGKPQSIGLEDSCKAITVENEIEVKLLHLLTRLMVLVKEDGRVPKTVKLIVRKFNRNHPQSGTRETRQCNVNTSLFKDLELSENNQKKVMKIIMTLFRKIVDTKKSFHITLLGLSFTKFMEKPTLKNTLNNFLSRDIEVQSVIDIENQSSNSPIHEPCASTSQLADVDSPEHLSKRARFILPEISKDCGDSRIKLGVATLRLNSTESLPEVVDEMVPCPPNANEEVFRALPSDLQSELWEEYRVNRNRDVLQSERPLKKSKNNSILNYIVREKKD